MNISTLILDVDNTLKRSHIWELLSTFLFLIAPSWDGNIVLQEPKIIEGVPEILKTIAEHPQVVYLSNGIHTSHSKRKIEEAILPGRWISRKPLFSQAFQMILLESARQFKLDALEDLRRMTKDQVLCVGNHGSCSFDRVDVYVYATAARRWPGWINRVLIRTHVQFAEKIFEAFRRSGTRVGVISDAKASKIQWELID